MTVHDTEKMLENLIPLVDAVELATGRRPHLSTVLRWCSRGSRGYRLESRVLGGRRFTTVKFVLQYLDNVTAASCGGIVPSQPTPHQVADAANRASTELRNRLGR